MTVSHLFASLLLSASLLFAAGTVLAQDSGLQPQRLFSVGERGAKREQRRTISASRAANIARSAAGGGKVLSVRLNRGGYYRVKVLSGSGVVRNMSVDAYSGRISR